MKLGIRSMFTFLLLLASCCRSITACGRKGPPPDRTKPVMICPPDMFLYADPLQINTKVWWDERSVVANDDRDGRIAPVRTGLSPGNFFSEGVTTISYNARDKSGNYASCNFDIRVKVLRCKAWGDVPDGWKICHVSHDMRRGSVCRFGCYRGHKLIGVSRTECLESEDWDTETKPYCQKVTCDKLVPTSEKDGIADIVCTDKNYYRSKCTYVCINGFSILPGKSKIRVCTEFGTWRGNLPKCVDSEPPLYTSCPSVIVGYAERSKTKGRIWWDDPIATDNSKKVTSSRLSGPSPGSELEVGEHIVKYIAFDSVNNTGICEFKVIVKQIKCHTIYPLPYTSIICPEGRIYGSACQFLCDNGTLLNGPAYAHCGMTDSDIPSGVWSFKNSQPYCEQQNTCPALRAPDNGALVCDTWLYGKYCQMLCQEGYVVMDDPLTNFDDVQIHKTLIVCGDSGNWYIPGNIPNCQEVDERLFSLMKIQVDYLYYDGVCNENYDELREKFMKAFTFATGLVCQPPACSLSNVRIVCGDNSVSTRSRRQSTSGVSFVASLKLSRDKDSAEIVEIRSTVRKSLRIAQQNGSLDIELVGAVYKPSIIHVEQPEIHCKEGSAQNKKTLQCVKCNVGYFHNTANGVCSPCARGYYQDTPKQTICKACPQGTTTEKRGAHSKSQCKEACPPGFYSATGTSPCSACDLGSYSDHFGSTECTKCHGSRVTLKAAANSSSQCKEFDVTFSSLNDSELLHVVSVPFKLDVANFFILTFFVKCQQCDNIVSITGEDGQSILSINGTNKLLVELYGDIYETNKTIEDAMLWTQITIIMKGVEFTTYINDREVLKQRSLVPAVSTKLYNFTIGGENFVGSVSQMNMWSDINAFTPTMTDTCFNNYEGDLINWGQVSELDGSFVFTNSKCDVEDNCEILPCHNGGSCIDAIERFFCICDSGYTGRLCDINIDDCYENACDNNGTCIDETAGYTCLCEAGFTGKLCETHFVNGGWTEWELSGACSVTCGLGEQQRRRVCESPHPTNGGKLCSGDSSEFIMCATNIECVNECASDPTRIKNGSMNCEWTNNETRVCKPACDDGFDFDSDMFVQTSGIICGPETGYTWNIHNSDNPYSQIPSCTRKVSALSNKINYTAEYPTLSTLPQDVMSKIKLKVNDTAKEIGCVAIGRCTLDDIYVFLSRETSVNSPNTYVMFSVELTCEIVADMDECYDLLADAVFTFNTSIEYMQLTIEHNGEFHDVGLNSSSLSGVSVCSPGHVPIWQYCVACGEGTYASNDYCKPCAFGFYQDMEGQVSCKKCPGGLGTAGLMSRAKEDCNVNRPTDVTNPNWMSIGLAAAGSIIAVALLVAGILIIFKRKKKRKYMVKSKMNTSINTKSHAHYRYKMQVMEGPKADTGESSAEEKQVEEEYVPLRPVCTDSSEAVESTTMFTNK